MKNQHTRLISVLTVVAAFAACTSSKTTTEASNTAKETVKEAQAQKDEFTYGAVANSVDFTAVDPSVDPREDFYSFANGTWLKNNPVPSTESSWGSFNELRDNNDRVLKQICEESRFLKSPQGSYMQVLGDFYFAAMDTVNRDKMGVEPLKPWLSKIDAAKDKKALGKVLSEMHLFGMDALFGYGIEQDLKDKDKMAIYTGQGGLSLPSKDYYFKTDSSSVSLREKFKGHVARMLGFIGYNAADGKKAADAVYGIEERLADASRSPVELRNPEANYNKMAWKTFTDLAPSFGWADYLKTMEMSAPADVIVGQPEFFKRMEEEWKKRSVQELKHYLKWNLISASASKLSIEIEAAHFTFYGTEMRGAKKMKSTSQRVLSMMGRTVVGEALGHAFVDRQFDEEAKKKVNEMVDNIFAVFKDRLDTLEWMGDETRKRALTKLSTFVRKLGYPDKWEDYSTLRLTRDSYLGNVLECNRFATKKQINKLGKPIDRSEWGMPPHIVNAYYNPIWNEIVFPAGIMQPPFFDVSKEDAVNYARMGAVIGHELTHGFDDQGSQFDAEGNLKNWWSREDSSRFANRTAKLVACFNGYEALPGINVNGELTLGENIADLGGLKIAYYAYERSLQGKEKTKVNGFTPEQRFFLAFGQIWKTNYTDNALKVQVFTNPHSPGKFRVLGPLSNMEEFYNAFAVKPGQGMYRNEEVRARIW